jgi:hypothetical protein
MARHLISSMLRWAWDEEGPVFSLYIYCVGGDVEDLGGVLETPYPAILVGYRWETLAGSCGCIYPQEIRRMLLVMVVALVAISV